MVCTVYKSIENLPSACLQLQISLRYERYAYGVAYYATLCKYTVYSR